MGLMSDALQPITAGRKMGMGAGKATSCLSERTLRGVYWLALANNTH